MKWSHLNALVRTRKWITSLKKMSHTRMSISSGNAQAKTVINHCDTGDGHWWQRDPPLHSYKPKNVHVQSTLVVCARSMIGSRAKWADNFGEVRASKASNCHCLERARGVDVFGSHLLQAGGQPTSGPREPAPHIKRNARLSRG